MSAANIAYLLTFATYRFSWENSYRYPNFDLLVCIHIYIHIYKVSLKKCPKFEKKNYTIIPSKILSEN